MRQGDWKLIEFAEENRVELYNLRDDIGEKTNLAEKMPDKAKELHARLVAWRAAVNAPMPTPNTEAKAAGDAKPGKGKRKKKAGE